MTILILYLLELFDVKWKAAALSARLLATTTKAHLCSSVQQQVLPACSMAPFIKASWSSWKQLE